MNLTYYPYMPFRVPENKITIFDVGTNRMFIDLYRGFSDHTDKICISDDNFELKTCASQCSWYGDVMFSVDLNKLFIRKVQTQIVKCLSDEQQVSLLDSGRELISQIVDDSFILDLPIEARNSIAIEDVMKFAGLNFSNGLTENPYDIIETLIQIHSELNIKKCIVIANVSHYVTGQQVSDLNRMAQDLNVTMIIIEFSETCRSSTFKDVCYYYIDEDFIDIRDF